MGVSWRSAAGLFLPNKPDSEIVPSVQRSLCWRRGHQEERRRNTWSIFILLEPTTPASTGTASLEMFHARLALTTMQTFERSHETELSIIVTSPRRSGYYCKRRRSPGARSSRH